MHLPAVISAVGVAALLLAGCAGDDAARHAAFERSAQRTRSALVMAGDPDSLEAVALFGGLWRDEPGERLALARRAAAAAPDRPDLAWLNLELCASVTTCDLQSVEARLRALDPGNGAVWAGSLARVGAVGDATALHSLIVSLAAADRFDTYWNPLVVHVANALIRSRTMDARTAVIATIGVSSGELPPYQPITSACRGTALEDPATLADCRKVAAVLRRGDTVITEMVGLAIATRVWPEDSAEYRDASHATRLDRYRLDTVARIEARAVMDEAAAQSYLALLGTHRREQEVMSARLASAGLRLDPARAGTPARPGAE